MSRPTDPSAVAHAVGVEAHRQIAQRQAEGVLDRHAGRGGAVIVDKPVHRARLARSAQPGGGHRPVGPQAVGAVEHAAIGVEHVDALDQVVGGAFALQRGLQRADVAELHAQRQRGVDAVLHAAAGDQQALLDDVQRRAAVLEEVQQPGHADGKPQTSTATTNIRRWVDSM
ncbi:hypothetical protein PEC18_30810 [Paucibacter sp. O1-1]|nr:hypothetical protein [Paucibacter sp. O1-1]MDA3830099.1 hypothetical protein [Paucibacter sp. O1-1]